MRFEYRSFSWLYIEIIVEIFSSSFSLSEAVGANAITSPWRKSLKSSTNQGQRQLTPDCRKDFEQEVRVPATRTAFHDQAPLARMLLE
jgi:hypothetical protein